VVARVAASRGDTYAISRQADGSINVTRNRSTVNFATKDDVAQVFEQLYAELYQDGTHTEREP
jgi:hypothetical protein